MSQSLRYFLFIATAPLFAAFYGHTHAAPARPLYQPAQKGAAPAKLEGLWRQVHVEFEGKDQNAGERPAQNRWRITPELITIITRGPNGDLDSGSWSYRVNFEHSLAALDLTPTSLRNTTYPCLLQLEGNRITVMLQNYPDRGRPKDLVSRPGSGIGKFIYERVE